MQPKKKKKMDPMAGQDYPQGGDGAVPMSPADAGAMPANEDPNAMGPGACMQQVPVAPADTMMMPQAGGQYPSTSPQMLMASIQQIMQGDQEKLAMEQMNAVGQMAPMMIAAVQQAQGMAQSIDAPGGTISRG